MFGGHHSGQSAFDPAAGSGAPWGQDASGSSLARDAGLGDIGRGGRSADADDGSQRAGLFDTSSDDSDDNDFDNDDDVDVAGDFGGDDSA
jgi:uncharacterized protein